MKKKPPLSMGGGYVIGKEFYYLDWLLVTGYWLLDVESVSRPITNNQ